VLRRRHVDRGAFDVDDPAVSGHLDEFDLDIRLGGIPVGSGRTVPLLRDTEALETRRVLSSVPLGLPVEPFSLDVDRSGQRVILALAGKPNDQRPATVYVLRDGRLQRVPFRGDCWQADW
jgi:hypothetical protein